MDYRTQLAQFERHSRRLLLEQFPKNAAGAEIGVHLGDFSEQILSVASPRKLFLVDPWQYESDEKYSESWYGGGPEMEQELEGRYQSVLERFAQQIHLEQVVVLRSSSETALSGLEDETLDFVYIDANHQYEFAKTDLELSLQKVKRGGYITGDDYMPGGWWKGGVKKAVDEFGWKDEVRLLWIRDGQYVFQKR